MRRLKLLSSTAAGVVIGAVMFSAVPAIAQMAVIDVASISKQIESIAKETGILDVLNSISSINTAINQGIADFNKAIGLNTYGDTNTLLRLGFTQNANYAKAQVGAQQQITDASNTVMSQFQLGIRQAQIRDEQSASPNQCSALDGGVATQSAAIQAYDLAATLTALHDQRGEAGPNMPSYYGTGQGIASNAANHVKFYCDANDQAAGLCTTYAVQTADADQRASSLFGPGTYADQPAVAAAKDYAINLIEPVAPGALRGDQLNNIAGQDAAVRRRSYNARMSLAQSYVDDLLAQQSPSVPITPTQAQYLTSIGKPVPQNLSMFQAMQIEAERRYGDVTWAAMLASAPPAAVEREIATELALSNFLAFQNYRIAMQHAAIGATQLAETAEHDFMPTVRMPAPNMAAN